MVLQARYYSNVSAVWQPFVENLPFSFKCYLNGMTSPSNISLSTDRDTCTDERCDITISKDMISTFVHTVDKWKEATEGTKKGWMYNTRSHPGVNPVIIRNDSGAEIDYWLSHNATHYTHDNDSSSHHQNLKRHHLDEGEEKAIYIDDVIMEHRGGRRGGRSEEGSLCIEIYPYNCVHDLTLSRLGNYHLTMHMHPSHHEGGRENIKGGRVVPRGGVSFDESTGIVYSVSYVGGCKRVVIRSNVMIKNDTTFPMHIAIHKHPSVVVGESLVGEISEKILTVVDAGGMYAVPIDSVKAGFCVRPSSMTNDDPDTDNKLNWSDPCQVSTVRRIFIRNFRENSLKFHSLLRGRDY